MYKKSVFLPLEYTFFFCFITGILSIQYRRNGQLTELYKDEKSTGRSWKYGNVKLPTCPSDFQVVIQGIHYQVSEQGIGSRSRYSPRNKALILIPEVLEVISFAGNHFVFLTLLTFVYGNLIGSSDTAPVMLLGTGSAFRTVLLLEPVTWLRKKILRPGTFYPPLSVEKSRTFFIRPKMSA